MLLERHRWGLRQTHTNPPGGVLFTYSSMVPQKRVSLSALRFFLRVSKCSFCKYLNQDGVETPFNDG